MNLPHLFTAASLALSASFPSVALPVAASAQASPADERAAAYRMFVIELQDAVEVDDREAILGMVRYPLRINDLTSGEVVSGTIDTPEALAARFDWVFDEGMREAILSQHPGNVFANSEGAMIGHGVLWFDFGCAEEACSQTTPVRIFVVNKIPPD